MTDFADTDLVPQSTNIIEMLQQYGYTSNGKRETDCVGGHGCQASPINTPPLDREKISLNKSVLRKFGIAHKKLLRLRANYLRRGVVSVPVLADKRNFTEGCSPVRGLTLEKIDQMWDNLDPTRRYNIRMLCIQSKRITIDIDEQQLGHQKFKELFSNKCLKELRKAVLIRTQSGGVHYQFILDENTKRLEDGAVEDTDLKIEVKTLWSELPPSYFGGKSRKFDKPDNIPYEGIRGPLEYDVTTIPTELFEWLMSKQDGKEEVEEKESNYSGNTNISGPSKYNITIVQLAEWLEQLDHSRWEVRNKWLSLVYVVHNIFGKDCTEALNMIDQFSKKSDKYRSGECERIWNRARVEGKLVALKRLCKMLREDGVEVDINEYLVPAPRLMEDLKPYDTENCPRIKDGYYETNPEMMAMHYLSYGSEEYAGKLYGKIIHKTCFTTADNIIYKYNKRDRLWHIVPIDDLIKSVGRTLTKKYLKTISDIFLPDANETEKKCIYRNLYRVERHQCGSAIVKYALSHIHNEQKLANLDLTSEFLPIQGHVLNLRTGEVRERTTEDLYTYECPVGYDKDADMTDIERFMSQLMCEDAELISFLQTFLGYAMTGKNIERLLFILWGEGSNGKSVLLRLMATILGKLYQQGTSELFMKLQSQSHHSSGPTPELACLQGKRIIVYSETKRGGRINEERVKTLTGQDIISARNCRENIKSFVVDAISMLLTNFKPECSTDKALWDRIRLVPFTATFVDDPTRPKEYLKDLDMLEKLCTEENLSALLNWLTIGSMRYYSEGLHIPEVVVIANKEYRDNEDIVKHFIQETHYVGDSYDERGNVSMIKASILYNKFIAYVEEHGVHKLTMRHFTDEMIKHTNEPPIIPFRKRCAGGMFYVGYVERDNKDLVEEVKS
jgi:putative DNA primase/helicase